MKKKTLGTKVIAIAVMLCLVFAMAVPVSAASKLSKPTNVKATLTAKTTAKVSWKKVKNAKSYEVYYSIDGSTYKKLVTTKKLSATQKKLKAGKTYSYKVRAINGKKKSSYSVVKKVTTIGNASPNLKATAYTNVDDANKVKLKWSKVKNATGYYVYKKGEDGYKLLKKTTALLYKDPTGELGTKYTYKVVPYRTSNGKTFKGTASVKSVTTRTSGYLLDEIKPYMGDYSERDIVTMGSIDYKKGFKMWVYEYDYSDVFFNLQGKYKTLTFMSGIMDETEEFAACTVAIYNDGDLIYSYETKPGDLPQKHTINVADCSQLKISAISEDAYWDDVSLGFADIIVTI